MRNVKWTTFWYCAGTIASLLVGGTFGVAAIRGDIKDSRTVAHNENVTLKHYVDSLHHDDAVDLGELRAAINNIPPIKNTTIYKTTAIPKGAIGLFTARYVDGKLGFFPVK
jgi:hypothetical protein